MSNPETFQQPTIESGTATSEAQLKLEKLLEQIGNFVSKEEFDLARNLLEENKDVLIRQLQVLSAAKRKDEVERLGGEVKKIVQVIVEGLANQKAVSTKQEIKTGTDPVVEENEEEIKFKDNKLAKILLKFIKEISSAPNYDNKTFDTDFLKKIGNTISSSDFSIDDAPLRSFINWGSEFYKREHSKNELIWNKFVEKMRDLNIFVICKGGDSYNSNIHVAASGPITNAIVDKVLQPGFMTSAAYEGKYPKVIEPAVVITKPRP